ncbi:lipopolysaccharide transport periplasmic protein LptA [Lysobacter sp. BMK333-48F3]|uniref:lipopolysaccharide transport periplasmic protein LptA n=1 Tax=Lysobacter sp. BMK333-48F3 TaxID=2867962 RepID=UPI001C8C30E7|nr:lipopolysaccharide transport periplasmic protein LptA [Lysobacter sp. BMK333-48F3]MBX9399766.1 lipopolysaccharide transport periplasmic protein LptA [Lysobacter sp. BMK333-48F3]
MKRKPANWPALCLAAALALAPAAAFARSSDRSQPMDAGANSSNCSISNDSGPCVLTGDVKITQGTLIINAAKADIKRAGGEPSFVTLTGSQATLKQELDDGSPFNGRANKIEYDIPKDTIVLTGNAYVDKNGDTIKSERIVYNSKTGQVESGGTGGRVNIRMLPKNKTAEPAKGGG